jgi:DNA modification methylase
VGREEVDPAVLLPHPKNWRKHPKAQVAALEGVLTEVGWVQDTVVSRRTGRLLDGHARVELALQRREPRVPVVYVDVSEEEEALVLASLDPISAMATTDPAKLAELLGTAKANSEALKALLEDLAAQAEKGLAAKAGKCDPDLVPPIPKEPTARPGDLFLLGPHRLLCGDATKTEDVARLMGSEKAACMATDPPYGVEYQGGTAEKLRIANDTAEGLENLLTRAFAAADGALAPGAAIYVAHPAGTLSVTFGRCFLAAGWRLHQTLVWVKDSMVLGHADYHYRHEPILFGYKAGRGRRGRGGRGWYGGNSETSVLEVPRPKRNEQHPTMKPVELMERMLLNSCPPGGLVYEPFAGSGSTLIAAERLSRRCLALELDPRYADVVCSRWEAFSGEEVRRG